MKKAIAIFIGLTVTLMAVAQTQQGYVKTKGELQADGTIKPGVRIDNVVIGIGSNGGETRQVRSRQQGDFSFTVPADRFFLSKAVKKGYVLSDPEACRVQYRHSSVPMVIVMEDSLARQMAMTSAIKKIRRTMTAEFQKREDAIEAMLDKTEQEKQRLQQQLNEQQANAVKLIESMAERFVCTDYDQVSDLNRRINLCILEGDLLRADSLIGTKGSFEQRSQEIDDELQAAQAAEEAVRRLREDVARKIADYGEDCYRKYVMFASSFDNDSAMYYLERRALRDSLNAAWQNDASWFACYTRSDYDKATFYGQRAYRASEQVLGRNNGTTASLMMYLGAIHFFLVQNFDYAQQCYEKAKEIYIALGGENNPDLTTLYAAMGQTYLMQYKLNEAEDCMKKAVAVAESNYGPSHAKTAEQYGHLADFYWQCNAPDEAKVYYEKQLASYNSAPDRYAQQIRQVQAVLAKIANDSNNNSIEYYTELIQQYEKENKQDEMATAAKDLGRLYIEKRDSTNAYKYLALSLQTFQRIYGDLHQRTAYGHYELGQAYMMFANYPQAISHLQEAARITQTLFGKQNDLLPKAHTRLAQIFFVQKDYPQSIEYYLSALDAYQHIFGENSVETITAIGNVAMAYGDTGDLPKALEYYKRALAASEAVFGPDNINVGIFCQYVGSVYISLGDLDQGYDALKRALAIAERVYGSDHEMTKSLKNNCEQLEKLIWEKKQ